MKLQKELIQAYEHVFHLKLPVIDNYRIYKLASVKAALRTNDTEIRKLFSNMDKHQGSHIYWNLENLEK